VLLVEDDADVRLAARAGLQRAGYRVLEAASGLDALRVWEQHNGQVDLLFSDMVMPGGISGLELAGRLRELRPGLKVIVSSGYSIELARSGGAGLDDVRFIPKPWQPSELLGAVREVLDAS
jgi:CheY-like chemotaxis protein